VTAPTSSAADPSVERLEAAYDASTIKVLEGLEAVRKRPSMYIGSTGERGLHHLVQEIVDNAVDEAMAGYCDRIEVTLLDSGGIRVSDNGRGIPVDEHPVEKRPAVTVALTVLHAGGKFGGGGYKVSGGLHGVGVSVVNALSTRLDVDVRRDGYRWTQSFAYGEPEGELERHEETDETGTVVTFWASHDIFETTTYSFETISSRLREMAFLNKGLEIIVRDERATADEIAEAVADSTAAEDGEESDSVKPANNGGGLKQRFLYERGLVDYVEHLNKSKDAVQNSVVSFETTDADYGMSLEVALQWTTAYSESVHTFANTINTHEGGTHEEGFRSALTSTVNW